jgi:hypothetical protein
MPAGCAIEPAAKNDRPPDSSPITCYGAIGRDPLLAHRHGARLGADVCCSLNNGYFAMYLRWPQSSNSRSQPDRRWTYFTS